MTIYVCTPPRVATGGVELLQQLVYELNRQQEGIAKLLYLDDTPEVGWGAPLQYEKYQNPYTVNTFQGDHAVFIVPEIWVAKGEELFKEWPTVIWWESVDNYFLNHPRELWYSFVQNKSMLHMAQSMYAKRFLIENGGISENRIIEVSDYVSEEFLAGKVSLKASRRDRIVLYNKRKGLEFTNKLIEASPELHWIPISGMSTEEIVRVMSVSRVYIDFGDHPGKDRMPREAAIRGCCIVTGRNGSASYPEDVPIMGQYKFERKEENIPRICSCIKQLVENYDTCISDFEQYRTMIRGEKAKFETAVGGLISMLREHFEE